QFGGQGGSQRLCRQLTLLRSSGSARQARTNVLSSSVRSASLSEVKNWINGEINELSSSVSRSTRSSGPKNGACTERESNSRATRCNPSVNPAAAEILPATNSNFMDSAQFELVRNVLSLTYSPSEGQVATRYSPFRSMTHAPSPICT